MSRKPLIVVALAAFCAIAQGKQPPAPVQITSSAGDSLVERVGPKGVPFAAIGSTGNLAVGAGNADGSHEVYELRELDDSLVQVTNSLLDSSSNRVTTGGQMVVSSRADLTPGDPGNLDGSYEAWLFIPDSITHSGDLLSQGTSSLEDSFFQTFWDGGKQAFFNSKGDLVPGNPGNTDGSNEVFSCDLATRVITQYTDSSGNSLVRGVCETEACAIVESAGDLTPGLPGNSDGSFEIFLIALDGTKATTQVTSSAADTRYRGQDPLGRYLGFESRGDLAPGAPGNTGGVQQVFVYDRTTKTLSQATNAAVDSFFDGFVPRTRLVLIDTRADLVPGRNADGSNELFAIDVSTGRIVQQTASPGDSYFAGFAGDKNGLGAVVSDGDLTGHDKTTVGPAFQAWMTTFGPKLTRGRRLTNGATDSDVKGFDASGKYVAIESSADLVAGKNVDLSKEVFVAHATGAPKLKQVTSSVVESAFGGFTTDGKTLLVDSRGNLAPAGGNADGSFEVFRVAYR